MKRMIRAMILAGSLAGITGCHTCDVCDDCGDYPAGPSQRGCSTCASPIQVVEPAPAKLTPTPVQTPAQ